MITMKIYYHFSIEKGVKLYRVQFQLIPPPNDTFCCSPLQEEWEHFLITGARNKDTNNIQTSINIIFIDENSEPHSVLDKISHCPLCGEEFKMIERKYEE